MTTAKEDSYCLNPACKCRLLTSEAKKAGLCYECRNPDYYEAIKNSGLSLEDQYKNFSNFVMLNRGNL